MLRIVRRSSVLILATFCIFSLAGCGGKKGVIVKGKIVFPQNMVAKDDVVNIAFTPQEKGVLASPAVYSPEDGTFDAKGLDGKGLLPGKYTITVSVVQAPGTTNLKRVEPLKEFNRKYDPAGSPLSFEVTAETTSITVDTAAGTVTKN